MDANWTRWCGASVLLVLAVTGCAQERDPINRVQADALAKSFFVGPDLQRTADDPEFYKRGTLVDVGYGAGQDGLFTSSYAQPVSRIRWEITEDSLNARLSYERVTGTDGKGNQYVGVGPSAPAKAANDGQLVASYKIASHFDIKRDYNPQTGEELNIVVENTSDRPWYVREYFRVDWSSNLVTDAYDYDTASMLGLIGGVKFEPIAYTVLDPENPDAPHFDAKQGYFDVTNKAYATPQQIDLASLGAGSGQIPACELSGAYVHGGTYPWANCNPVEITIRESYRKVVDTDYEPMDFDGVRFQTLGAFNFSYRRGYARNYGMLDREWNRFIARYNIWEKSHYYAIRQAAGGQGPTGSQGAGGQGSTGSQAASGAPGADGASGAIPCATTATTETCKSCNGDPNNDPNRDNTSHFADDGTPLDTTPNGTADECEAAGSGSRCDIYTQKCTLPYRERTTRTVPWYVAGDTSLFDPTNWAVIEWDLAMKTAVQTSRLVECRKTTPAGPADATPAGGQPSACDTAYPMWTGQQDDIDEAVRIARDVDVCNRDPSRGWGSAACTSLAQAEALAVDAERQVDPQNPTAPDPHTLAIGSIVAMPSIIVLCHNPVDTTDHPACGHAGLAPRLGDIRYNTVLNIPTPQIPGYWGIMVDADDPITGEKVAGSMNIWTHTTDLAAQSLVDMVRYINGELTTADVTNGTYVQNWATAAKLSSGGGLPTLSRADISRRLAGATKLDAKAFDQAMSAPPSAEVQSILSAGKALAADVQMRGDVASPAQAKLQATLNLGRGTSVETQLLNPAMLQLAGAPSGVSFTGAQAARVSPLALNNPLVRSRLYQAREQALAARGACLLDEAPEPTSMTGLADILAKKFPKGDQETASDRQGRYDRMFHYVQQRYHYAVLAHEMGHSIGLRHNFVSSAAPLFYRPQYWQLRTRNGTVKTPCTDAVTDGSTCVGPRYWDPTTAEEQSQIVSMWMQSTVMDYAGDVSQDLIGLGVTDFAAARFFYGDNVSVYQDPSYRAGTDKGTGITAATDTFGGILGIRYGMRSATSTGVDDFHYSELQNNYQVISGCRMVSAAPPPGWDEATNGKWDALLDGHIVTTADPADPTQVRPTKCRQQPVDYVSYTQLRLPTTGETKSGFYAGGPSVDAATSRVRVPYAFASDNWADLGNVSVFRHDNGADPYEQVQFLITTQENRHIFDNYRRGRSTFSLLAASQRSFDRYNIKLQGIVGGMGFYGSIYDDLGTSSGYSFDTLWPYIVGAIAHDNIIAATMAFDHFERELARPEPGRHYKRPAAFLDPVLRSATDGDLLGSPPTMFGQTSLLIPNGSTGYFRDVGFGGHPLENALSTTHGDFDVEYIQNAGSYYDKINTAILFALSEDRFISQSRRDFYDARFRAAGVADVLPEGFRRVIANALTGDRSILGPRVEADANGLPILDDTASTTADPMAASYPKRPLGWVSAWPTSGPQVCFATDGRNACTSYAGDTNLAPAAPANVAAVDPQIGWEVQKFLIAWTVALVKANEKTQWTDMMRIWRLGENANPEIEQRIEWQDPGSGEIYYARDLGSECLFGDPANGCAGGKMVTKGIAARVLEYANELTSKAYKLDTDTYPAIPTRAAGFNAYGRAMFVRQPSGAAVVLRDRAISDLTPTGSIVPVGPDCDQNVDPACVPLSIDKNHWAKELASYKSVPDYLWQAELVYGWFSAPGARGVY